VPEALPVFAVLGAVATAAQRHFLVSPQPCWTEHTNLYTAVALPPGNNKSLVTQRATAPLRVWEAAERERLDSEIKEKTSRRKSEAAIIERTRRDAGKARDPEVRDKLLGEIVAMESALPVVPVLPKL